MPDTELELHYSDVIMSAMASQSPMSRLFAQAFVQALIIETSKLLATCLCEGNRPFIGGFPAQRVSTAENINVLMHDCVLVQGYTQRLFYISPYNLARRYNILLTTKWKVFGYKKSMNYYLPKTHIKCSCRHYNLYRVTTLKIMHVYEFMFTDRQQGNWLFQTYEVIRPNSFLNQKFIVDGDESFCLQKLITKHKNILFLTR